MKNLLLLSSMIFLLFSCNKEQLPNNQQETANHLTFSKSLALQDAEGNSVNLTVYANTQEALDDHNQNVLHLITDKQQYPVATSSTLDVENIDSQDDADEKDANFVYIKVENYNFRGDVRGFSIKSALEDFGQESNARYRETRYHYAYSADNVVGARVTYTSETRSEECIKTKLSKKTSSSNLFWQSLGTGTIRSVGDSWSYCGSTIWAEYKLRVRIHKARAGVCCWGYNFQFLISC